MTHPHDDTKLNNRIKQLNEHYNTLTCPKTRCTNRLNVLNVHDVSKIYHQYFVICDKCKRTVHEYEKQAIIHCKCEYDLCEKCAEILLVQHNDKRGKKRLLENKNHSPAKRQRTMDSSVKKEEKNINTAEKAHQNHLSSTISNHNNNNNIVPIQKILNKWKSLQKHSDSIKTINKNNIKSNRVVNSNSNIMNHKQNIKKSNEHKKRKKRRLLPKKTADVTALNDDNTDIMVKNEKIKNNKSE
eukprot:379550_1